jgi:tetratricopeptide (TPR) repeat protein
VSPTASGLLAATLALACAEPVDFDALWDYDHPAESEARFRALLASPEAPQGARRLELETQLARALGLQGRFDEASALLDEVERALPDADARVRTRYHLERGRALRSSGSPAAARPEFTSALAEAERGGLEALAADALHMLALVAEPGETVAAHRAAIARIERSRDPEVRRWLAPLTNNLAWALHDRGEYAEALAAFERALALYEERGNPAQVRIARWSVARALRSLGRNEEALARQRALAQELAAASAEDGFVEEEIAECLLALGRSGEARPHFAEAYRLLAADAQLARDEPARLARLRELGSS